MNKTQIYYKVKEEEEEERGKSLVEERKKRSPGEQRSGLNRTARRDRLTHMKGRGKGKQQHTAVEKERGKTTTTTTWRRTRRRMSETYRPIRGIQSFASGRD